MDYAEKVLNEIKSQAREDHEEAIAYYSATEDVQKEVKEQLLQQFLATGVAAKTAEDMASAQVEELEATGKKLEYQGIADQVAAAKRAELVEKFGEFGATLKQSLSGLGDAIKEDFGQLTAMFGALDQLPGFKTIKALLGVAVITLSKMLLQAIKNMDIMPNFIKDRISMGEDGGVSIKDTLENFKPDWALSDKQKEAKGDRIKKEASDRMDQVKAPGKKGPKLKADGSKDMRFKENQGFFTKMQKGFSDKMKGLGESFGNMGKSLGKGGKKFKAMGGRLMGSIKTMGATFMTVAKSFFAAIARFAMAAASFLAGLAASAVSMLIAAAPLLLKALLIAAIVAGLIFIGLYVYKKFQENKEYIMAKWEQIKQGFMNTMDQLILWKDKATAFLGNVFKQIWLSVKSLFASIMTGIENGINMVIAGINALIPGERYDLDPVDIGAGEMRRKVDEEQAAFEVEKAAQAEEFAQRQKDIDDARAANTVESHMAPVVQQNNNTVNEGNKQTTVVPTGTTPLDTNAGNMALAQ